MPIDRPGRVLESNSSSLGAFAHLNQWAGTNKLAELLNDPVLKQRLKQDFKLTQRQLLGNQPYHVSSIDVNQGQLTVKLTAQHPDPCEHQAYLSISLLADETLYVGLLHQRRLRIWHQQNRIVSPDLKQHAYPRPVAQALRQIVKSCQRTIYPGPLRHI